MLLATFRTRYPEFSRAADTLVQACLDEAVQQLDVETWGAKYDQAHGLKAAHLLALSPWGTAMRLNPEKGKPTTYSVHFDRLLSSLGGVHFEVL